jgi:hypothetical protein
MGWLANEVSGQMMIFFAEPQSRGLTRTAQGGSTTAMRQYGHSPRDRVCRHREDRRWCRTRGHRRLQLSR